LLRVSQQQTVQPRFGADGSHYLHAGFQPALEAAAKRGAKPVVAMVNSFAGRIPLRSMPAYTASKYALAGFTDAIRPELADVGIHVAQIHPGAGVTGREEATLAQTAGAATEGS
jgi:NAD(P)-dependent dehydrogenase (short-subunit alcohol dehydrogenase family)